MRAIVLDRPGSFRVTEVPDPTPGPGQVVVKVDACGICGTDLHIMDGEFPPTPYPITPGHEFAGTIAAVGADGTIDLPVGTPDAVHPSRAGGHVGGRGRRGHNGAAGARPGRGRPVNLVRALSALPGRPGQPVRELGVH